MTQPRQRLAVITMELGAAAPSACEELCALAHVQIASDDAGRCVVVFSTDNDATLARYTELLKPWLKRSRASTQWHGDVYAPRPSRADGALARFVAEVTATDQAWGVRDRTWARSRAAGEREALPLWPSRELAAQGCTGAWAAFVPKAITLVDLLDEWLPAMLEDGLVVVVSPLDEVSGLVMEPEALMRALLQRRRLDAT